MRGGDRADKRKGRVRRKEAHIRKLKSISTYLNPIIARVSLLNTFIHQTTTVPEVSGTVRFLEGRTKRLPKGDPSH